MDVYGYEYVHRGLYSVNYFQNIQVIKTGNVCRLGYLTHFEGHFSV